jgi:acyl-CoA synthetase (NDP forming)
MSTTDPVESLRPLLQPASIAIVGASRTPGKSGNMVLQNLVKGGFGGRIFPINPAADKIEGLPCFPSIAALPERPDCAMLVIPASEMVEAVQQCAKAGVRTVVVAASGFSETGEDEDIKRQATLADIARSSGMRMLGPNTSSATIPSISSLSRRATSRWSRTAGHCSAELLAVCANLGWDYANSSRSGTKPTSTCSTFSPS